MSVVTAKKKMIKKGWAMALCVMLCLTLTGGAVYAETGVITIDGLNYRIEGYTNQINSVYWFQGGQEAVVSAPDGYELVAADQGDGASFSHEVNLSAGKTNAKIKAQSDGTEATVDFSAFLKWDSTPPAGHITIKSVGVSDRFFNGFTDNAEINTAQYYNPVTVSFSAEDADSGIKSIQYYIADKKLWNSWPSTGSEIEDKISGQWSSCGNSFQLTLAEAGSYVVYAKITDNVGNVTYISTNEIALNHYGTAVGQNDITWFRITAGGSSLWFGIDNSDGTLRAGSRLQVELLKEGTPQWQALYDRIDTEYQAEIEAGKLRLFRIDAIGPDGNYYGELGSDVTFYMQMPDHWKAEDLAALFISEGNDEKISAVAEKIDFPAGRATFARLDIHQFTVYAVYDTFTQQDKEMASGQGGVIPGFFDTDASDKDSVNKKLSGRDATNTGDENDMLPWVLAAATAIMLAAGMTITRKGRI